MTWAEALSDMESKVLDTFKIAGVYASSDGQGITLDVDINSSTVRMGDKEGSVMFANDITATVYKVDVSEPNYNDTLEVNCQKYRVEHIAHQTVDTYTLQLSKY